MPIEVTCEQRRVPHTHLLYWSDQSPYTKGVAKQESNHHYSSAAHGKQPVPLDIPWTDIQP